MTERERNINRNREREGEKERERERDMESEREKERETDRVSKESLDCLLDRNTIRARAAFIVSYRRAHYGPLSGRGCVALCPYKLESKSHFSPVFYFQV